MFCEDLITRLTLSPTLLPMTVAVISTRQMALGQAVMVPLLVVLLAIHSLPNSKLQAATVSPFFIFALS